MFSGQAFDADYISNPSKKFVQPVTRPDVFDLTVSVKQNFGGNNPKPKGNFSIVIKITNFSIDNFIRSMRLKNLS